MDDRSHRQRQREDESPTKNFDRLRHHQPGGGSAYNKDYPKHHSTESSHRRAYSDYHDHRRRQRERSRSSPHGSRRAEFFSRRCRHHQQQHDYHCVQAKERERFDKPHRELALERYQQYGHDEWKGRHHHRRKRQRLESNSPPLEAPAHAPAIHRRSGIVSVDYQDDLYLKHAKNTSSRQHRKRSIESPSESSRNDDSGHYKGDPGSMIGRQYQVLKEVGMGTFGRVLDCLDLKRRNCVAVKVVRAVKRYYESALIEAKIVQDVNRRGGRGLTHCVRLFDSFTFHGHYCLAFESLGPSLYDFLKRNDYSPFPMIVVQDVAIQLLQALEFLHSFQMIHTDLKLENILLTNDRETIYQNQRVPESTLIKLIDFGSACYDDDKRCSVINTRQYRAPEVILGTGWSMPSDVWSAGCLLVELYKGELLFATHDSCEHLALMDQVIGTFPTRLIKDAFASSKEAIVPKVFDERTGRMLRINTVLRSSSASYVRKAETLSSIVRDPNDAWFFHLLCRMLVIDPQARATAHESLKYLSQIHRNSVRCA
ncbi:hypothetical protein MPSEU_000797400 [Mayamaea pseudoterrestris]|nr:hypothetical protein MPSEU_000797400 [Mayamaea pseudoterrestris]